MGIVVSTGKTLTSLDELAAAVDGLKGWRVTDVGRTLNMVEVGFASDGRAVARPVAVRASV